MTKWKWVIVKISIVVAILLGSIGAGYYLGNRNDEAPRVYYEGFSDVIESKDVDILVKSISAKSEIVLVEETGVTSISLERYDQQWNSLFTKAELDVSVEYRVKLGVDLNDLIIVQDGDNITVFVREVSVLSNEMMNENIISKRTIFANEYNHREITDIKKQLLKEVENRVLGNSEVQEEYKQSFEYFINNIASSIGINTPINVVFMN